MKRTFLTRRRATSVTIGVAILLTTMSIAWACTTFVGGMYVNGNGTGNVAQFRGAEPYDGGAGHGPNKQEGQGPNGMDICGWATQPTAGDSDQAQSDSFSVRVDGSDPALDISVFDPDAGYWGGTGRETVGCTTDSLRFTENADTYTVKLHTGYMWGGWPQDNHNCHQGEEYPYGSAYGGLTIDTSFAIADGEGSESYTSAAIGTLATGWYSVCVVDVGDGEAMSLNFKVV